MDDDSSELIEPLLAPAGSPLGQRFVTCFFTGGGPLDGKHVLLKADPDWHTPQSVCVGQGDVLHGYSQLDDVNYWYRGVRDGTPPAD